jgi:hypothetical protein
MGTAQNNKIMAKKQESMNLSQSVSQSLSVTSVVSQMQGGINTSLPPRQTEDESCQL